jgi:hypothetical protein
MPLAHESLGTGGGNQVTETEFLRTSIQEFLNTSIDPYISYQLMQEGAVGLDVESGGPSAIAMERALAHQTSAILTDITSQASMGEDEVIDGLGSMLRREEPYSPWTTYGSNLQSFDSSQPNPNPYAHVHDLSFNYGSLLLPEPFSNPLIHSEWGVPYSKGKEILVDQSELVLDSGAGKLNNMSLLQQELLEKLRSPRASSSPRPPLVPGFRNMRMPPGHSATSLFQRPRHVQKTTPTKKSRLPLIVKWATKLASRTARIRDDGPAGSFDDSPGTDTFEYRSPNSVAHDQQQAVAHKHAERIRRMKFSHKLQTLISIVPMTNKKKDKVSVLTSTIEYIRQLNSQISTLKKVEEVGALSSRIEEGTLTANDMDREEELTTSNDAGPSTSEASPIAPVVVVEESSSPGEDSKWVIKVEANCHSRSFIQLLNVLLELELETVTVNYGRTDGRFHANISVKTSRNARSTSIEELQGKLCRVLETSDSSQ